MSDTPRTDALLNNKEVVVDCAFLDHARQLERELAALRSDNLTAHKMACAAGIERDTLRAERLRNETFWLGFLQDELAAQQKANK